MGEKTKTQNVRNKRREWPRVLPFRLTSSRPAIGALVVAQGNVIQFVTRSVRRKRPEVRAEGAGAPSSPPG